MVNPRIHEGSIHLFLSSRAHEGTLVVIPSDDRQHRNADRGWLVSQLVQVADIGHDDEERDHDEPHHFLILLVLTILILGLNTFFFIVLLGVNGRDRTDNLSLARLLYLLSFTHMVWLPRFALG